MTMTKQDAESVLSTATMRTDQILQECRDIISPIMEN